MRLLRFAGVRSMICGGENSGRMFAGTFQTGKEPLPQSMNAIAGFEVGGPHRLERVEHDRGKRSRGHVAMASDGLIQFVGEIRACASE